MRDLSSMNEPSEKFRDRCCRQLRVTPANLEKKVLLACLPRRYRLLGWLRWYVQHSYFEIDLLIIKNWEDCTSMDEAMEVYENFQDVNGFQRGFLRFRITKHRVKKFLKSVFQVPATVKTQPVPVPHPQAI